MDIEQCQLCSSLDWEPIDTLSSGIWKKGGKTLEREELSFPIGQCNQCGHVQVTLKYTEDIFEKLYFSDIREPNMFFDPNQEELIHYKQMVRFFGEHLKSDMNLADFGCGVGNTFKAIKKLKPDLPLNLYGIDFHPMIENESVQFLSWDLNDLAKLPDSFFPEGIDIAMSTHVLEHVINPVQYLSDISRQLNPNGKVFIEVPDCSHDTDLSQLAFANVVHGQHIHYYTKSSLHSIASRAGMKIIKTEQIVSGSVPRLLLLMEKAPVTAQIPDITETGKLAITSQLNQVRKLRSTLASQLLQHLKRGEKPAIWGVGGDSFMLLKEHPELISEIQANNILLYDLEHAGKRLFGQVIESSLALEDTRQPIYITPLYEPTRERMKLVNQKMDNKAIDPYCSSQ